MALILSRSSQDIVNQGVLEVCDRTLFDLNRDHVPTKNGPLDPRMGVSEKTSICETCGQTLQACNGHFGYIKLALPVLHVGYLKAIIATLQNICKVCFHEYGIFHHIAYKLKGMLLYPTY